MTTKKIVFLDTTVFADRLFGPAEQRRAIDIELEGGLVLTSRYVREQFRGTFLRAMVLVYNQLRETQDVIETLRRTDHFKFFKQGDGVKARKVLCAILEHPDLDVEDILDHLERSIVHDLMGDFDALCSIVDTTSCCLCSPNPEKDEQGIFRFEKSCTLDAPRPCRIEAFWGEHHAEMRAISDVVSQDLPPRVAGAAREVVSGALPRGKRCYVDLSDAVIVAEAPAGATLLTSNEKDFVPLARVLGQGRSVTRCPP